MEVLQSARPAAEDVRSDRGVWSRGVKPTNLSARALSARHRHPWLEAQLLCAVHTAAAHVCIAHMDPPPLSVHRPDGLKKAYVRLTTDYDALDVANKIGII